MACINDGESPADFCRRMGWGPGTQLRGLEAGRADSAITLTAVGRKKVLLVDYDGLGEERIVSYFGRVDWSEVPAAPDPAEVKRFRRAAYLGATND